jgi:hypothetical protein
MGKDKSKCGRGKVRTKEERLDGIEISSDFCLAFAVNETYIGAKEQEAVPKAGFRPSGRSFRGVQKASSWEADLSAFRPHSVRKTPEKGIPSPFEAFPQVQADKAEKRANLGTFR